jgi:hypothetical protein
MTKRVRAAPAWLHDGFAAMWHEVRSYLETTWALVRHPVQFADQWFSGTRTGATLVTAARQLGAAVLGLPHPDSLIAAVASALGPYAHYVLLGLLFHAFMVPFSKDRVTRVSDTVALALYAGAGPVAVAESIGWLLLCALSPFGHQDAETAIMLGLAFTLFCFVLGTALGSLHRPSPWRIGLAFTLAFPVTGLVFGYLDPPGSYGLHWVMRLSPFELGLGM